MCTVLKVTARCNLDCTHCNWKKLCGEDMPTGRWFQLLRMARAKGCVVCIIEGGEPLLRGDIGDIVDYARELGMFVTVITNGTHPLSMAKPDSYWISIDGAGDSYESIRGKGNYRKVLDNLAVKTDTRKISLTTLSRKNMDSVEQLCEDLSELVDSMIFNFIYPYDGLEDQVLTMDERRVLAKQILGLKKKYRIINSDTYLKNIGNPWKCWAWTTLNIAHDGKIHQGCTVEQLEPCKCDQCSLGCAEQSHAYELNLDSIDFLLASLGKRKGFLFIKDMDG